MLFLKRKLPSLLRLNPNPSSATILLPGASLRCCFSTSGNTHCNHFMVDYLVESCGFSQDKAMKQAPRFSHLESTERPDSVIALFRSHGFNDAQIKKIVGWYPQLLLRDVETYIESRFRALQDMGFSELNLVKLILNNPSILLRNVASLQKTIDQWRELLGSAGMLPISFFWKNQRLFTRSFEKIIFPNIRFLQSSGVSDDAIAKVVKGAPRFIIQTPDSFKKVANRVEEMGLHPSSKMFIWAMPALSNILESRFKANFELIRSFGWSQAEIISSICKKPQFIRFSIKTIRLKVDYLLKNAGLDPSYLIRNPVLLTYSLDKRITPRHSVIEILASRGLRARNFKMNSYMSPSEKYFIEKFILSYKEEAPDLHELYNSFLQ